MKNYIIVGDNNLWYAETGLVTEEQLQREIQYIKDNLDEFSEDCEPTTLYVYETMKEASLTINL